MDFLSTPWLTGNVSRGCASKSNSARMQVLRDVINGHEVYPSYCQQQQQILKYLSEQELSYYNKLISIRTRIVVLQQINIYQNKDCRIATNWYLPKQDLSYYNKLISIRTRIAVLQQIDIYQNKICRITSNWYLPKQDLSYYIKLISTRTRIVVLQHACLLHWFLFCF